MYTIQLTSESVDQQMALFGPHDDHVKIIEKALSVTINARNSLIEISGEDENAVNDAGRVLDSLKQVLRKDELINPDMVHRMVELVDQFADKISKDIKVNVLTLVLCITSVDEKISREETALIRKLLD